MLPGSGDAEGEDSLIAEPEPSKEKEKEAEKWDVNCPPDAYHSIDIDVDEGTWMNVDLSPDGKTIAFDLLGDIYVMSNEGGEATALTSGIAWDMQPRFSPDGKQIAFTSDRAGGDNIWVMSADGADPKQVTKESFRLLNAPAWSPDGQYIVARKHFTSRRSIGSGEMWLYHVTGGDGLQMTEKPNEQKDVNEPVFSPDGKYLYYSRDATPGGTFEYSKDPNGEIYAIFRLNRETGEVDKYIGGPGGAVRPTPSPDGKRIAFVRRVRYQSTLFLKDVETGKEWPIYDDLTRDMQETWAIHGVYPTFAWTPDSKSIVFYAKGKIRRIDCESGTASVIPFHVNDTRKIADALRFPIDVAPDKVHPRILRWTCVTPDGKRVVYQALGHLWTKSLPDGEPRRLTTQTDHFELYPSLSRDGRYIVYSTWNDKTLGEIRVLPIDGGASRVVTQLPGHYVEPVISPDGRTIVYRSAGGGYLRSPLWSDHPGFYAVPFEGGEPRLVSHDGSDPQFGVSSDRVYFYRATREGKDDVRKLVSIDLDGSDERDVASGENVTSYIVSPDGKWLAFVDQFNARVMPLPATGKTINVSPKMKSIPCATVSRDAGEFVQFSSTSDRLYWTLGSELFQADLKDAFSFLAGAPEKLPDPPEAGIDIAPTVDADRPEGLIALRGARIITMHGDDVIENGTIIVKNNRIMQVGPADEVDIPSYGNVVDVSGKTIIPGLVDVHDHGPYASLGIHPQQNWALYCKLAFGVTTTHDPSHDTHAIFSASEMQRAGEIVAPRIFSTGTILYGAKAPFKAEIDSLDDARSHLRRMKAAGAISVKSYNQPRREQRQQVLAAARELGMMVVPEGGSLLEHNLTMVVDGHTGVEHSIPVADAFEDVLQLWGASQVGYTPTLVVAYGGNWGENYWYQTSNVWEHKRLSSFMPRFVIDPRSRRRPMVPDNENNHISNARVCKKLLDRGVRVNLGAHGQLAGLAQHWEIWMFEQGGMTPLESLRCATMNPAHYVGLDDHIGSIEQGKLADLVVLDANPLESIRNTDSVHYTMINGRLYDSATMDQIWPEQKKREPFFWEE
ncbi:MAG: PD40 domain-containing protein [Phycisphaerales bacterium]|nr:PD40 domain-containing protein [Phycisphaerales bacterium]MCB9854434.1 PD40 domain-containing protein [Phycisphaerales bacterium]